MIPSDDILKRLERLEGFAFGRCLRAKDVTDGSSSEGVGRNAALDDHSHAHGNRGGGALHAVASLNANGFMSTADKAKLNSLQSIFTIGAGLSLISNTLANTGLLGVTAFGTAGPSTTGLSVTSQLLALTAATESQPGGVSAVAQNFGGVKTFWVSGTNTVLATFDGNELRIDGRKGAAPQPPALKLLTAGSAVAQFISTTAGAVTLESLLGLTLKSAGVDSFRVDGTGTAYILGGLGQTLNLGATLASDTAGTGDFTVNAIGNSIVNANDGIGNATHIWKLNGTPSLALGSGALRPNFASGLTLGTATFPWGAAYLGTVNGGTLSGNNSGDVTLTGFGSTPNSRGLTLAGQTLNMQPADATNPGGISTTTQTLGAGRKTVETLTTGSGTGSGSQALTVRSSGTSVNALAEFMQGGSVYGYVGMGTDNVMRMEVLSSRPLALKNGSDRITVNTSDMALAPNPLVGVTIDSDFAAYDSNSTPRVVLEQSGRLTLTGGVKRNSGTIVGGEALLTTPSGYRPATRNRFFTVQCYGGVVNVTWQTDGVVVVNTVGGVSASPHLGIWFDGVSFDPRA